MIFPRTTLTAVHRALLESLESIRARRERSTAEISTGLRVRQPSDGPVEAAAIVQTQSVIEGQARLRTSLQAIGDQLRAADTVLNQAADLVTRAATLGSQAANFNQTAQTRAAIAGEVAGIFQNLLGVANAEFGGKFLFSGLAENTRPFVEDPSSPDGVVYRGDPGRRSAAFPGGQQAPISLDGRTIFLLPESIVGSGRTAGVIGSASPTPPVGVGVSFSGGIHAAIYADLPSFFVGAVPAGVPAPGDQVTVTFTSTDGSIAAGVTATLAGGENAGQIAAALNAQVALTPVLAGKISFLDEGGRLKVVESDSAGVGFRFTASATGGLVTGLEPGGTIGGLSAGEIAAALNAQVAQEPSLQKAGIVFTAANGEVQVDSDVEVEFTVVDFPRGTGFASGLAGRHHVGGESNANVFRALNDLYKALLANDVERISSALGGLRRAVSHLSAAQAFYGATENLVASSVDSLNRFELVNQEKLSSLRDADLPRSISELTQAQVNEEATLRVMASQPGRNLFDFLA